MISLSKQQLTEALKGFRSIKIQNNHLPCLKCVLFDSREDALTLTATNIDETLVYRASTERSKNPIAVLIAYDQLRDVQKHSDSSTPIVIAPRKISFHAGGVEIEQEISAQPIEEFPVPVPTSGSAVLLDPVSVKAIQESTTYASSDSGRYVMQGIHISPNYIAATDGRRLYTCNSRKLDVPLEGLILPAKPALNLFADSHPICLYQRSEPNSTRSILVLTQAGWEYHTKAIEGKYPNWKQVVPQSDPVAWLEIHPDDASKIIKSVHCLVCKDQLNAPIRVACTENHAAITDQLGEQKIVLSKSRWHGNSVVVGINRNFLVEAMRGGLTHVQLFGSLNPLLLSDDRSMRKVVIMPLRSDGEIKVPAFHKEPDGEVKAEPQATEEPLQEVVPEVLTVSVTAEEDDPYKAIAQQIAQIREYLRLSMGGLSSLQGSLKELRGNHKALERDAKTLRRGLRELQKLELTEVL